MQRINQVDSKTLDSKTANTLTAVKSQTGMLPNMFSTLAQSPSGLDSYMGFNKALTGGGLSNKQRELIAIAVAEANNCEYCLSAHAELGRMLGVKEDAIQQARHGGATDQATHAVIEFALEVVRTRGDVSEEAFQSIRSAYADDGIMIEIVANVALNILTNYVNRQACTEVDFPIIKPGIAA